MTGPKPAPQPPDSTPQTGSENDAKLVAEEREQEAPEEELTALSAKELEVDPPEEDQPYKDVYGDKVLLPAIDPYRADTEDPLVRDGFVGVERSRQNYSDITMAPLGEDSPVKIPAANK